MSKRSYRRLAVVAGAALAVGSVAPAMAVHVGGVGSGSATVDVSDVTLPSTQTLNPRPLVTSAWTYARGTVVDAYHLADETVEGLENDLSDIVELFSATSSLSVNAGAGANANSGGATVSVSGSTVGGADVLGLVPDPNAAQSGVEGRLAPLVEFGRDTLGGALGLAEQAKGTVVTTGNGAVDHGLNLVNGTSVSVNAVAALMASL